MSNLVNNKVIMTIIGVLLFIVSLPILNILLKSIFAVGQAVGTYTRMLGY